MKIVLGSVRGILEALVVIVKERIPVKTAYWFSKTIQQLQSEFSAYEDARLTLAKEHALIDEKGNLVLKDNVIQFPNDEAQQAFVDALEGLNEQEVEIQMKPISIDSLGNINLSTETMIGLGPLLKEE